MTLVQRTFSINKEAADLYDEHQLLNAVVKNIREGAAEIQRRTANKSSESAYRIKDQVASTVYNQNNELVKSLFNQFGLEFDLNDDLKWHFKNSYTVKDYTKSNLKAWLQYAMTSAIDKTAMMDSEYQLSYQAELQHYLDISVNRTQYLDYEITEKEFAAYMVVMRYIEGKIATAAMSKDENSDFVLDEARGHWNYTLKNK